MIIVNSATVTHATTYTNQFQQTDKIMRQQINMNYQDNDPKIKSPVPVIGVLSQVLRDYKRFTKEHHLHIASSYVKWLESAGAQVVPVLLNQNDSYYEQIFKQTNGLLLPGGDNLLDPAKNTPMMVAAKKLYKMAVEANDRGDFYPIWGTCLGLELLSVLTADRNVLDSCSAIDEARSMRIIERGKLFAPSNYLNLPTSNFDYSGLIVSALTTKNLTYHYHKKCLTDAGLKKAGLTDFYRPLAYSSDSNGLEFITVFEAIKYPFYGVQFHPEKPPFEFVIKMHQLNIPHSRESIAVSRYFADFFVQQARLNSHSVSRVSIQDELIYAFQPTYTAIKHDMYEQRYLFPFGSHAEDKTTTEEFIDYIPADEEEVHEDVSEAGRSRSRPQQQNDQAPRVKVALELTQVDYGLIK